MKLKIIEKTEQPLLERENIVFELEFEKATPSRKEIIEEIAKQMHTEPKKVVVFKIDSSFGSRKAKITAYIYKEMKSLELVEEKKKLARTGYGIVTLAKKEEVKQ